MLVNRAARSNVTRGYGGSVIVFGHDWGAPIFWAAALLHPVR
jgi:pimeloyl-ACP methyl ester carboxylesterase